MNKMRDYFDPIYYASSVKEPSQGSRPVKKSHSVVGSSSAGGNVFGRFLKLGKSRSDVYANSKSRPASTYVDDLEEDFRLSPSVLNRGPVEKMVHNSRKDVSRSHSWIYGSVKLPSDLPFGYGYGSGFESGSSPSGSDSNSGDGSPTTGNHAHNVTALQIPRCQMSEYYACECSGEFDFLPGGIRSPNGGNKPCKACAFDWALGGEKKSRKGETSGEGGKTFVNSVRKLTWKSLKQAVKKRPSLDNMKKSSELRVGVGGGFESQQIPFLSSEIRNVDGMMGNPNGMDEHSRMNGFFSYSQHAFSADDIQPNYFFPEKKNMYASCTDIFRDPSATASVRVRPKPARQSWQFTNNESGPVPNYQEDNVYHSEWDLRQCIPYDVWVNTTSNVKPRTTLPPPRSEKPPILSDNTSRNSSLSKSTSVPYLSEIGGSSSSKMFRDKISSNSNLKAKSSSSISVNNNSDTISLRSVGSSVKTVGSAGSCRQNGIIKRPSILSADVNAYQLLKAQTKNSKSLNSSAQTPTTATTVDDELSSSSDDLSDNALTADSHMRIAGQKIYMPPNTKGKQPPSTTSSSISNGKLNGEKQINGASKNLNKRIELRQGSLSSRDEWTDEMENQNLYQQQLQQQGKQVPISREGNLQQNTDKSNNKGFFINGDRRNPKTAQSNKTVQQNLYQRGGNDSGTRASLNNGNYDNHCENNDFRSNTNNNMIENGTAVRSNQTSSFMNTNTRNYDYGNDGQSQIQRDYDVEENHQVEFEEFVFEDRDAQNNSSVNNPNSSNVKGTEEPEFNWQNKEQIEYCIGNGSRISPAQMEKRTTFIKNGQNVVKRTEIKEVSSDNLSTNVTSNNKSSNGPGKFGALRRRKSRNGSNNPGKLLREVIYEEEVEHDHATHSISQGALHSPSINTGNVISELRSNKSNEYAVKIVVSGTTTDYVKPILKNRERVYDAPSLYSSSGYLSSNDKEYANYSSSVNNNDIYFDSSISTTSVTSTLKKKVQFDQNKVIVCGGDSGPDSDDYGVDDTEGYDNQEKSQYEDGNYGNEENTSCQLNEERNNSGSFNQKNHDDGDPSNQKQWQSNNNESGSVSLKSNLSIKSALSDNSYDNSNQYQSPSETKQKIRSTFEEEVVQKAAAFALARSRKQVKEVQEAMEHNANSSSANTSTTVPVPDSNDEECFDGRKVNNLTLQLNEHQSRFTSTSTSVNNPASSILTQRKSSLKSNWKSPVSSSSLSSSVSSQGTRSATDHTQQPDDVSSTTTTTSTTSKERIFVPCVKNSKASHGVAAQIMKAKRIPGGKCSANDVSPHQEKIINPNSLLFNDTTRIRLNQRPSMNETFKLNLSTNGQGSSSSPSTGGKGGVRLKQSSSFRTLGSSPLRPSEPPPPPPPTGPSTTNTTKSSSTPSRRLQMSISSSISGQLDKLLTKSSSTTTLYGSNLSLNGNRLLSKSEISLPMDVQTTSNQASHVIKNQNTHGQKANGSTISNHNNSNKSSGFEANGAKTSGRSSLSNNGDCKKIDGNANSGGSKSLSDRCEALDKMLVGVCNNAKTNSLNTSSASKIANNNCRPNPPAKSVEIVGKMVQSKSRGNLKSNCVTNTKQRPATKSSEITKTNNAPTTKPVDCRNDKHNIEIVTKENAVSEIRIYSSTSTIVSPVNNGTDNKISHQTTTTNRGCKGEVDKQEIHYAATDIFPQKILNENKNRQPPPLPPISQGTIVAQTRPQSTSVVLIVESSKQNNGVDNCIKVGEQSASPLTYSQPIDSLSRNSHFAKPSNNSSPLTSKENDLPPSSCLNPNPIVEPMTEEEPLYDDVIHHNNHTPTNKSTSSHQNNSGSLGRKFLMASLSSMNPIKKQLTQLQEYSTEKRVLTPPTAQVLSSTLPCMACPPSLPPPNLPSKNVSEFTNRPVVLKEHNDGDRVSFSEMTNDQNLDEEVDNLYNDISEGGVSHGVGAKSLHSFASSMKGALLNAIKNMDFDRRSLISNVSNNSGGSQNNSVKYDCNTVVAGESCNLDNCIYDDTLSLCSGNSDDGSKSYKTSSSSRSFKIFDSSVKSNKSAFPAPPSSIRSNSSTIKQLGDLEEHDEDLGDDDADPLYDDVINYSLNKSKEASHSSDSGAESEDAIPPPLPTQGPPKISKDLPVLTFPLLLNKSNNSATNGLVVSAEEKVIGILFPSSPKNTGSEVKCANKAGKDTAEAISTRTRSLLNELNEKLSQLNSLTVDPAVVNSAVSSNKSPLEFTTYSPAKNNVSSSSASSGVEEDYNSEKNYSLSNSSDGASGSSSSAEENYKLAQVTKLVTETITMARGKFLDSMKSTNSLQSANSPSNQVAMLSSNRASPVSRDSGSSPCISDEPIYEEIGDMNRSHSPIYADAFDAKSIFDGASRNEILSFLESIRDRLTTSDSNSSGSQSSSVSSKKGQESIYLVEENGLSSLLPGEMCHLPTHAEEETEEYVAQNKIVLRKLCPDCNDVPVDTGKEVVGTEDNLHSLCHSCNRKRNERKEIITEIHETEMKYGRDLAIISEEFYKPIQIAGLLNKEQLDQIFLNVGELTDINAQLTILIKTEISAAIVERTDEDLVSVNVGKIFLDIGENMMTAFQTYCTRQSMAGALLAQLEKEKELLRIFLRVSQMENTTLRRMNLPAFLMVPVQRVTRYPLLLSRLLKVTPVDHFSREELQSAHEKIEQHLEHMNKATREVSSVKLWRRISIINGNNIPMPRRSNNELEGASVSIKKMSIDVLDWTSLTDITCIIDNQLGVFHFNGKPLRGIYACLIVRGKDLDALSSKMDNDMFFPPAEDIVKEVKLVLVRVKNTRFCLLREPLCLAKCVVSQGENEFQDFVEINEITSKNTYHLQGIDKQATATWLKYMQCYSMCVGQWRRRRPALANIMMNGMLKHL